MADADDSVEWRAIEAYPAYEVSNHGKVRRILPPNNGKKVSVPYEIQPQIEVGRGRIFVALANPGATNRSGQKRFQVSRLVAVAFHGPAPSPSHVVCHCDGDHTNNHYRNLRWDTQQGNIDDKVTHGTMARGSRIGVAKITEADVPKIRAMLDAGHTQQKVAEAFGIDQTSVSLIKNRRIWQHVP